MAVAAGKRPVRPLETLEPITDAYSDLIESCWHAEPDLRLSNREVEERVSDLAFIYLLLAMVTHLL